MFVCCSTSPLLLPCFFSVKQRQDWNLLKGRAKNLAGRNEKGMRGITKAEVRQHNTQHDCWSIFRGKVSVRTVRMDSATTVHTRLTRAQQQLVSCVGYSGASPSTRFATAV